MTYPLFQLDDVRLSVFRSCKHLGADRFLLVSLVETILHFNVLSVAENAVQEATTKSISLSMKIELVLFESVPDEPVLPGGIHTFGRGEDVLELVMKSKWVNSHEGRTTNGTRTSSQSCRRHV
jgi:uncharacterized protein (UPF0210 family)